MSKIKDFLLNIKDDNYKEADWIIYNDIYIQILKGDNGYCVSFETSPPGHYPLRDMLEVKYRENPNEAMHIAECKKMKSRDEKLEKLFNKLWEETK